MIKYFLGTYFVLFTFTCIDAQMKGYVRGISASDTSSLNGAKVKFLASKSAIFTNSEGIFECILPKKLPDTMVVSYPGFISDTIMVNKEDRFTGLSITLFSYQISQEVLVVMKAKTGILKISTLAIEKLTSSEFRRAACCNLSESFETNASVDVSISDGVTGAKKIQMLGLDGVYTQFQMENIPFLRGLEASFGLNSLSGIWLESIQISKGTGSVVNGNESMAGLINLELKQPKTMDRLMFNAYQNRFGRSEMNILGSRPFGKKWHSAILTNGAYNALKFDGNRDGFIDVPLGLNAAVMNRWQYNGDKMEAQLGVYAYKDDKKAGQMTSTALNPYLIESTNSHLDLMAKTGFFGKKSSQSLGIIYNVRAHQSSGFFDQRSFKGDERRAFVSAIYEDAFRDESHKIKMGFATQYVDIYQQVDTFVRDRTEFQNGVFAEHQWQSPRLSLISGFRLDYNSIAGWQWLPRIHAKWALTPTTDLRFTIGKGWRLPNYLFENISLLANRRQWVLPQNLSPEVSWNVGGSLAFEGRTFNKKSTWVTDVYYTWFEQQLVIDRDQPGLIVFDYQRNQSYSVAIQTEGSLELSKQFDIRVAYKFLDVKSILNDTLRSQTMIPKHRILLTSSLQSKNKRFQWDLTLSVMGSMRMPNGFAETASPWYPILNSQATYRWKKCEVYLGLENALNVRQNDPIMHADHPENQDFDATMIWGPITGINVYTGFKYALKK